MLCETKSINSVWKVINECHIEIKFQSTNNSTSIVTRMSSLHGGRAKPSQRGFSGQKHKVHNNCGKKQPKKKKRGKLGEHT